MLYIKFVLICISILYCDSLLYRISKKKIKKTNWICGTSAWIRPCSDEIFRLPCKQRGGGIQSSPSSRVGTCSRALLSPARPHRRRSRSFWRTRFLPQVVSHKLFDVLKFSLLKLVNKNFNSFMWVFAF